MTKLRRLLRNVLVSRSGAICYQIAVTAGVLIVVF